MTGPRKIIAIGIVGVLTFVLGTIGFREADPSYSLWSAMFAAIQLFTLSSGNVSGHVPWTLELARWIAMAMSLTAVLSVAARVAADGWLRLRLTLEQITPGRALFRPRCVVVGLGRKGMSLVDDLRVQGDTGYRVLGIDRDPERVALARSLGVAAMLADATEPGTLQRLTWRRTRWVVLLMGNDESNLTAALDIARLRKDADTNVAVHVPNLQLRNLLARQDALKARGFRLFNYYERLARRALLAYPIEALGITGDAACGNSLLGLQDVMTVHEQVPHVFIRPSRHFTAAIVSSLARSAHIPALEPRGWTRIKVIIVGPDAEEHRARLQELHPALRRAGIHALIDLETLRPGAGESAPQAIASAVRALPAGTPTTVFLDVHEAGSALIEALAILDGISVTASDPTPREGLELRCIFDFAEEPAIAAFVNAHPALRRHLMPLPSMADCCGGRALFDAEDRMDDLARAIHAQYDPKGVQSWDSLTLESQDSNRAAADHIGIVMRALLAAHRDPRARGFEWEGHELEALAECEHRRWAAQKLMAGWEPDASLGEAKDERTKRHGCLDRSYDELSEAMKERDRDNVRLIPVLLARAAEHLGDERRRGKYDEPPRSGLVRHSAR